jgi:hypothetical protein
MGPLEQKAHLTNGEVLFHTYKGGTKSFRIEIQELMTIVLYLYVSTFQLQSYTTPLPPIDPYRKNVGV